MNIAQAAGRGMLDLMDDLLGHSCPSQIQQALVAATEAGHVLCVRLLLQEHPSLQREAAMAAAEANRHLHCAALLKMR